MATVNGRVRVGNIVRNPSFEIAPPFTAAQTGNNWIDGTAAGHATNTAYKWYFRMFNGGVGNVKFDTSEFYEGATSLRLEQTSVVNNSSITCVNSSFQAAVGSGESRTELLYPVAPSTQYTVKWKMKTLGITNNNAQGAGVLIARFNGLANTGSSTPTLVRGTTGWTEYSFTFTTGANDKSMSLQMRIQGETGVAWFDDIEVYSSASQRVVV